MDSVQIGSITVIICHQYTVFHLSESVLDYVRVLSQTTHICMLFGILIHLILSVEIA